MNPNFKQENKLKSQGYHLIAGVDEVGRGAWAGPLVAAAVVLRSNDYRRQPWHKLVRDSKELSAKNREEVFSAVKTKLVWSVGIVSNQTIDKYGLAQANKQAVTQAIIRLRLKPDFILTDYIANLGQTLVSKPARAVIDGDASIFSVALASIIAKVYRDRLMKQYDSRHPGYGFAKHKGYGTKQHAMALVKLGPCALHRQTYRPIRASLL